jgi:hypothetical protein
MTRTGLSFVLALVAVLALAGGSTPALSADSGAAREYKVKAAFIYNFAQFVEWPADAFASSKAPIVIGIVGDDPFDGSLENAVRDKTIGGRSLLVEHYKTAANLAPCHILFVPRSEAENVPAILQKTGNFTLTVGETDDFCAKGGAFRFLLEDNKVRFEVNVDTIRRLRIKVSAKLLKLAKVYGQ